MPWGWECRAKLVKQLPVKFTERRGPSPGDFPLPGPQHYEVPEIFCGKGFGHIKRAPAYSFGHLTPVTIAKPAAKPNAPIFNLRGMGKKGQFKVTHGVVTPQIEPPGDHTRKPGPAQYAPRADLRLKRLPAYSCRLPAPPPYQPWDQWTPSPNMYLPPINRGKKAPAYSLGSPAKHLPPNNQLGPGEHDPKYSYVEKNKPAYSFGYPFKRIIPAKVPPPNHYCDKKYMVTKRSIPAPSFGIRHTEYLGKQDVYLKSSKLDLIANGDS